MKYFTVIKSQHLLDMKNTTTNLYILNDLLILADSNP